MYLLALFNMQGSDEHCKSFKWLDCIPCRRGAETAPIVIAKFTMLEAEAATAKNNEMEAPCNDSRATPQGKSSKA